MKKIVRLTESELNRIVEKSVRRAINEGAINESWKDIRNTVGAGALGAAALATDFGAGGPISTGVERQAAQQAKVSQADPATKNEFGKELKGKKPSDKKTASWPGTNNADSTKTSKGNVSDSRISRAVMESIKKLMNEAHEGDIDYGMPPYRLYVDNDFIGDFDDIDEAIEEGERFGNRMSSGWDYRDVVIYDSDGEDVWSIKSNGFAGEF